MKNKKLIYILVAICGIAVIIAICFIGDKKLDINSKEINELYSKLGDVDLNHCGGLITYSDSTIKLDGIKSEDALCMAYHQIKIENINEKNTKISGKNENKIDICKVGSITLSAEDNESECKYQEIDKSVLEEAYNNLYGHEMQEENVFYTSPTNACYKEGDKYICGKAESYQMSLAPEYSIYRIIRKATQKLNGDIIIEDSYLKISANTCYTTPSNNKNNECSKFLENKDLNNLSDNKIIDLVNKYGTKYKHTFKKNANGHYWFESKIS